MEFRKAIEQRLGLCFDESERAVLRRLALDTRVPAAISTLHPPLSEDAVVALLEAMLAAWRAPSEERIKRDRQARVSYLLGQLARVQDLLDELANLDSVICERLYANGPSAFAACAQSVIEEVEPIPNLSRRQDSLSGWIRRFDALTAESSALGDRIFSYGFVASVGAATLALPVRSGMLDEVVMNARYRETAGFARRTARSTRNT